MRHFRARLTHKEDYVFNVHRHAKDEDHPRVDYRNKVCVKPWGFEFLAFENQHIAVWIMHIQKGHSTSLHCHFKKDTQLIVLEGTAKVTLSEGKELCVACMSSVFIPRYAFHGVAALSPECVVLEVEIYHPECVTWSDKNDLLRLSDPYKRKSTGYEKSVTIDTDLEGYNAFFADKTVHRHGGCVIEHASSVHLPEKYPDHLMIAAGALCDGRMILGPGSMVDETCAKFTPLRDTEMISISRPNHAEDAKIVYDLEHLILLNRQEFSDKKVILTSGCFDIVHAGHIASLRKGKLLGDLLVVCLSNDAQIRALKGDKRPINDLKSRCDLIKAIPYVDYVVLYNETDIDREETLDQIMRVIDPFSWVKGNEYDEPSVREKHPHLSRIDLIDMEPGQSTTHIITKVVDKHKKK